MTSGILRNINKAAIFLDLAVRPGGADHLAGLPGTAIVGVGASIQL